MNKWEKLNKEFDDALNSMTPEAWDNWYEKFKKKQTNKEEIEKTDWFCPKCKSYVSSESVTFEETHQICNTAVSLKDLQTEEPTAIEQIILAIEQEIEDRKECNGALKSGIMLGLVNAKIIALTFLRIEKAKTYFAECHLDNIPRLKQENPSDLDQKVVQNAQ